VLAGVLLALLAVVVRGPWQADLLADAATRPGDAKSAGPLPPVLAPVTGEGAAAVPTPAGLTTALASLLKDPALGDRVPFAVSDAATGRLLYGQDQDKASTPASTAKLTTAVAALAALGSDHRLTTRTVAGPTPGSVVLVGGGDPTLTALDGKQYQGRYEPAKLSDLAAKTAEALKATGVTQVTLTYDASLYTGPVSHPIGKNENIAPVVPLMADEGRIKPAVTEAVGDRLNDPAADAAAKFSALLAAHGVTVTGKAVPGQAPAGAAPLGEVTSPPMSDFTEQMLTASDNDMAEAMIRQVALKNGQPASFAGGAAAVRQVLEGLGVKTGTMALNDGSGLDKTDKLPPAVLTQVLALAASPQHPELRPAVTGMPVGGFTGTLADRYDDKGSTDGAGLIRAKTGSLTGVSTLAGLVRDNDGRLLAFAFLADRVGPAEPARTALDRMATTLAACGCAG
jgi:D-alanyl-D-alanine carboxypeptidase/D-alanyl-D-alanine-endopeptidase (penicillin-binding protein 4)